MSSLIDLDAYAPNAVAVLTVFDEGLSEPSREVIDALALIAQILDDVEQGRHPMQRSMPAFADTRWPSRPHWDHWANAMNALALATGARVVCSQKYEYLNVEIHGQTGSAAMTRALYELAELVALASDYCLLYTSPSPRDQRGSRMPSSA